LQQKQLQNSIAAIIQQVMNGSVTVRQAEDLEGGSLTYAEIKAIASGNPAVMEKVRVDTKVRKLDQLRAGHINQQYQIRRELNSIPPSGSTARRQTSQSIGPTSLPETRALRMISR
jgi:hypothetical protein